MDSLERTLLELKTELDNLPLIKEYLSLKEAVESDHELKHTRLEIARLSYEGKKEEHDNLLNAYNNHPLVMNYQQVREEVVELLKEIRDVLNK